MSFEGFVSEGPLAISPAKAAQIFNEVIVPRFGVEGDPVENPTYILVGGQSGSGKTTSIRQAQTGLQGVTQKIIPDEASTWLPGYAEAATIDPTRAFYWSKLANSIGFIEELEKRAVERRANVVAECASPVGSEKFGKYYRQDGYRTELHVIATPDKLSWTSAVDRTVGALKEGSIGSNVVAGWSGHRVSYAIWPRAVFDAEEKKQYDRVVIKNRDGKILYENELVEREGKREWQKSPRALEALLAARQRPFTPTEIETARDIWERVLASEHRPLYNGCGESLSLETVRALTIQEFERAGRGIQRNSEAVKDLKLLVRDDVDFCLIQGEKWYGDSPAFERRLDEYYANISAETERHNTKGIGRALLDRVASSVRRISSYAADFLKRPLRAIQTGQRKRVAGPPSLEAMQGERTGSATITNPSSSVIPLGKLDFNKPLPQLPASSANLDAGPPSFPKGITLANARNERTDAIRSIEIEIAALEAGLAKTQQGLRDISQRRQALHRNAEHEQHSSIAGRQAPSSEALDHGKKDISINDRNTPAALNMPRTFDASRRQSGGRDR